jgi:hypothetical protein
MREADRNTKREKVTEKNSEVQDTARERKKERMNLMKKCIVFIAANLT